MSLSDLENGTGTGTQLGDDTLVGGNWRSTARTIGDSIDAEDVQVAVLPVPHRDLPVPVDHWQA
jgi:hypothetical protein